MKIKEEFFQSVIETYCKAIEINENTKQNNVAGYIQEQKFRLLDYHRDRPMSI